MAMLDKFKMTVTINRLSSPKLHEALSECPTDRERAAVFRALAESALAGYAPAPRTASVSPLAAARSQPAPQPEASEPTDVLTLTAEPVDAGELDDAIMGDLGRFLS
jgi:hypothetical protein